MNEAFALVRAYWLTRTSYRLRMILALVGLLASVVPVYFVADALQPMMNESISDEGGQYF